MLACLDESTRALTEEALSLLVLLVQIYLLYWYKSTDTDAAHPQGEEDMYRLCMAAGVTTVSVGHRGSCFMTYADVC